MGEDIGLMRGENLYGPGQFLHGFEERVEIAAGAASNEDIAFVGDRRAPDQFPGIDLERDIVEFFAGQIVESFEPGAVTKVDQQFVNSAQGPFDQGTLPCGRVNHKEIECDEAALPERDQKQHHGKEDDLDEVKVDDEIVRRERGAE